LCVQGRKLVPARLMEADKVAYDKVAYIEFFGSRSAVRVGEASSDEAD
jgi:hypothetical protein